MARIFTFVCILLHCGLMVDKLPAQLRGYAPPAAREPARVGLLGGLREAREERFRREAQAATAAARAAAPAARNPNANQLSNPTANPNANAARGNNLANNNAANSSNPNNLLRRAPATPNSRTANYGTGNYGAPNYGAANSRTANSPAPVRAPNLNPPTSRNPSYANNANAGGPDRDSSYVAPASSNTFVPSPMRTNNDYNGPGVTIRLPANSRGVVNYLVDNVENNTVRPGEQQVLDIKDSYVIRYSRGVTADGRSFGESRYTVTEGVYRFELTSNGWELYRESDVDNRTLPPNRVDLANDDLPDPSAAPFSSRQSQAEGNGDRSLFELPTPRAGSRELVEESLATELPKRDEVPAERSEVAPANKKPVEPEASAEELPAPKPRSILEN